MVKTWKISLGIFAILSGIGNAIKIYEMVDRNMKIDMAWLILAIIFITSVIILLNEFMKDYRLTRRIAYQLFLESEGKRIGKEIAQMAEPEIQKIIQDGLIELKKNLEKSKKIS